MGSDAQAIVDVTLAAAEPAPLDDAQRYAVVIPSDGQLAIVEPPDDEKLLNPRRASGTSSVYDVDSLEVLWKKHAGSWSEAFASVKSHNVECIFNADAGAGELAGHRDHRARLVLEKTPAWIAWTGYDGQLLAQDVFAQFIEDRLPEVVEPSGAEMLEIATSIQALTNVDFKSAVVLNSSTRQFKYEETTVAKAGQTGELEIPATFTVALQPFEASAAYRIQARFRYRVQNGNLLIGYRLERPEDVIREAFTDVVTAVSEAIGQQVLLGEAPPSRR